jgi:hypothetical protein
MNPSSSDTDWKMIGWVAGAFLGGVIVGAFLMAPMVEKLKKKGKKPDATTPAKP